MHTTQIAMIHLAYIFGRRYCCSSICRNPSLTRFWQLIFLTMIALLKGNLLQMQNNELTSAHDTIAMIHVPHIFGRQNIAAHPFVTIEL